MGACMSTAAGRTRVWGQPSACACAGGVDCRRAARCPLVSTAQARRRTWTRVLLLLPLLVLCSWTVLWSAAVFCSGLEQGQRQLGAARLLVVAAVPAAAADLWAVCMAVVSAEVLMC